MTPHRSRAWLALATLLFVAACGGGGDDDAATPDGTTVGSDAAPDTSDSAPDSTPDTTGAASPGRACGLLDETFLDDTFADEQGTFGDPYDFGAGVGSPDGLTCTWDDGSTGLSLRLTLEDAASAETDDHSGRAYNIDVEPVVEPQDGPGEKAVLLVDQATSDLGGEGFPYGYFFVEGDDAVFIETVGLDVGADKLRTLADEAAAHIAEG